MILEQIPPVPPAPPFHFERHDCLPVGVVLAFAGLIAPFDSAPIDHQTNVEAWGWMVCDGRELESGAYPELYAVLGCLYGGRDGQRYFCLPDYRGYFQRGVSTDNTDNAVDKGLEERCCNPGSGSTGSKKGLGSVQEGMVQKHEHQYKNYPGGGAAPGETGVVNPSTPQQPYTTGLYTDENGVTKLSGSETRPVNIAVNYIIKYAYLGRPSSLYR